MERQWEMETQWELYKLLITGKASDKYIMFVAGTYGIFVQAINRIVTTNHTNAEAYPAVVVMRTQSKTNIEDLIANEPRLQAMRIFKSGNYFRRREQARGFLWNVMKNMTGFCKDKTVRIKSDHKWVSKMAYEIGLEATKETQTRVSYDYDQYDYTMEIRVYRKVTGILHIVAILYGDNMPNHYKHCGKVVFVEDSGKLYKRVS